MRQEFTVATFNLLNLIGPEEEVYERKGLSHSEYAEKITWIANLFDVMDADVIAVQEVWRESALQDVCRVSRGYKAAKVICAPGATPDNKLPKVGLISRLPLLEPVESISEVPTVLRLALPGSIDPRLAAYQPATHATFSRPVLRARLNMAAHGEPELPLTCLVLHLKSKRPERMEDPENSEIGEDLDRPELAAIASLRSLIMRGVEATAIRHLAIERLSHSNEPVMVLGDFNDSADAVTTEIISGRAAPFDKIARDHLLYNACHLEHRHKLRREVGYTHVYQGDPDTLDHILVSEQFNPQSQRAIYRLSRLDYFNDHLWQRSDTTSDHGALRATFIAIQPPAPK